MVLQTSREWLIQLNAVILLEWSILSLIGAHVCVCTLGDRHVCGRLLKGCLIHVLSSALIQRGVGVGVHHAFC